MNDQDEEDLSAYADGRLEPARRAALEKRLMAESALARRLRLLRAARAAVVRAAPSLPADLKAALLASAGRRAVRPPFWGRRLRERLLTPWSLGAGLAFAAAGLLLLLRAAPERGGAVTLDQVLAEHESFAQALPLSDRATLFAERAGALEAVSKGDSDAE